MKTRLKKLVADLSLERHAESGDSKNGWGCEAAGEVRWWGKTTGERAAALRADGNRGVQLSLRSTRSDATLRERLVELARKKPRWGYGDCTFC